MSKKKDKLCRTKWIVVDKIKQEIQYNPDFEDKVLKSDKNDTRFRIQSFDLRKFLIDFTATAIKKLEKHNKSGNKIILEKA